ncbi:insulin-like growth factor-binding protein complex acid labile subunit [Paramacrobiotus metropolitanus]|uniref:insulin-like growth factor-binding protein complex acid labile subunit n=1 Tax=Paramacrobiotus metropolitanus TaxID=2943436 RepID=UPI0024457AEC|nr:insulin-like growth factor-binding protein complex acid labile subunit [Paramacrobiotus metropolitanus]
MWMQPVWALQVQLTFVTLCVLLVLSTQLQPGKCQNRRQLTCPRQLLNTPCTCRRLLDDAAEGLEVVCENADVDQIGVLLHKIPKETPIKYMRLRGNQMVQIPRLRFEHLHIQHLFITRCNVQMIDDMAFFNLESHLHSLDLSGNLLTAVPTEALRRLHALRVLHLAHNLLTGLHVSGFAGLGQLHTLTLDHNDIDQVHLFAFNGSDNLTKITLGHNRIRTLPARLLATLGRLEELQLQHNQLETLPEEFFHGVTGSLTRLDLGHNVFRRVPGPVAQLYNLEVLLMNHNCLEDVAGDAFTPALTSKLQLLDVSSNNISRIPVEALWTAENLAQLNMRNNSLTELPDHAFAKAHQLEFLYLQENQISNVSVKALHGLHRLEWLYLARNNLSALHEATFKPVKSSLKILDIHDNPLRCDCQLKWLTQADWPLRLSHEEDSKCREPAEAFGWPLTRPANYPPLCHRPTPRPTPLALNGNGARPAARGPHPAFTIDVCVQYSFLSFLLFYYSTTAHRMAV